jgi:hypothetical protein
VDDGAFEQASPRLRVSVVARSLWMKSDTGTAVHSLWKRHVCNTSPSGPLPDSPLGVVS